MARGWESKSVEDQIDMAERRRTAAPAKPISAAALDIVRKREGLMLSRIHVVREMENARNPRYKEVLTKALSALDNQIAAL